MKILTKFVLAGLLMGGLASCGDDCTTCSGTDPIFGIELSSEACDNGDGTITVSTNLLGISQDTTYEGTLDEFIAENQSADITCN